MSTYITPAPHADHAAEPSRRASRFDERGIALQTIIIMVVLLAIAGAVSAVLFSRASEETARLETTGSSASLYGITNSILCSTSGGTWHPNTAGADGGVHEAGLTAAGLTPADFTVVNDAAFCAPT